MDFNDAVPQNDSVISAWTTEIRETYQNPLVFFDVFTGKLVFLILNALQQLNNGQRYCTHCKERIQKIWNKFSQKRNCAAKVPISTLCLWAIYIFPHSICLFCCRKYVGRSLEYINRSQTHECGNWDWGRAIPRKGTHKWDFRCIAWIEHSITLDTVPSPCFIFLWTLPAHFFSFLFNSRNLWDLYVLCVVRTPSLWWRQDRTPGVSLSSLYSLSLQRSGQQDRTGEPLSLRRI
jgi:hypothetical protein